VLENSREMAAFFRDWLLTKGVERLVKSLSISVAEARQSIIDHVQVCFDTCHVAVAYEEPIEVLNRFKEVGLKVGKIQISSALKVLIPTDCDERKNVYRKLCAFAESTYLHQVIQR